MRTLSKLQVCVVFRTRVICHNVPHKFIEISMETPYLCPCVGHKHGGRNYEKKNLEFTFARRVICFLLLTFVNIFLLIVTLFRMLKIAGRFILKIRNSFVTAVLLMSRTMKIRKLKLFYFQKNARYRAK